MTWLKRLFSRDGIFEDLSEEIQEHLDEKVEELVAGGMPPHEAALAARREFGNVTAITERGREVWRWPTIESFLTDVRFGLRQFGKSPSFTSIALLTLALGIGANATVFSWIRTVILDPLPGVPNSERIVAEEMVAPSGEHFATSYPDYRDLRDSTKLLDGISATRAQAFAVGNGPDVDRIWGEVVSGNFFDMLGVKPEVGRFFSKSEQDDALNAHPVVVISQSFWTSRYRSQLSAIGASIRVNNHQYTIIGVAPASFHGSFTGQSMDMWLPVTMFGQLNAGSDWMLQDRKTRMFNVLARLSPGTSQAQASEELHALARSIAQAHADTNQGMSMALLPLRQVRGSVARELSAPLAILMAASGVLLLIVCANVANLLLARASSRQKEFSLRIALGAPRARLVRQLLTEVLLLTTGGAILGAVIASWLGDTLRWLVPTAATAPLIKPGPDTAVLAFTAALAFGSAILAGISPALQAGRQQVSETLIQRSQGASSGRRSRRLASVLVTAEVALAVVTLVAAGLFVKSFWLARGINPGFDANGVALAHVNFSSTGFNWQQADAYSRRVREQLEHEPGVSAVSYSDFVPLSIGGDSWEDLQVEGYAPRASESMKIYRTVVAPGYFHLMRIPLMEGRDFDLHDDKTRPLHPVMIVNQEFVRRFLPGQDPIGRRVHGWGNWFTIVGVVKNIKYFRIDENPMPYFYVPARQIYRPEDGTTFYVRTSGSVEQAMTALRRAARAADATLPIFNVTPLDESIAGSLFGQKIAANLLTVLAGSALLLACIGLYGVMAYAVAQRTNEIGIRVSLGARRGDILNAVTRQGLRLAVSGLAIGSLAAMAVMRAVSPILVSAADPAVYAAVAAFTILIALVAAALPAHRALRVDPIVALRYE